MPDHRAYRVGVQGGTIQPKIAHWTQSNQITIWSQSD
jgi:hypothetical protein